MMLPYYQTQVKLSQVDQHDKLERAARQRMVRDALAGRRGRVTLHPDFRPLLRQFGGHLVAWGSALQERYAALERPSAEVVDTMTMQRAR